MASTEANVVDRSEIYKRLVSDFKDDKIPAFLPGEREYELSSATANLLYRFTRPHFVVQPRNWADVLMIVEATYREKLHGELTIKCGGHSYTGYSTVDKGILVDLKRMKKVRIVFEGNKPDVAVIQGGARWGDVYRALVRDDCLGYVVNGGRCPSVGVGGFILGGGLSPFGRTIGMGCDTLVEATIITLDSKQNVVRLVVNETSEPDLFWALRGGGSSAFGIVTEFKMKVCKLKNPDPKEGVTTCRFTWYPDLSWKLIKDEKSQEREVLRLAQEAQLLETMNEFYAAEWPDEMTIDSNWMLDMNGDTGKLGIRFTAYYDGPKTECDKLFEKYIKSDKKLQGDFKKRMIPEPSTRFLHETLFLMWEEEALLAFPKPTDNFYQLWCSFVFTGDVQNMQEVIRIAREEQAAFEKNFKNEKAELWVTFIHSGGQTENRGNDKTSAYPWRKGVFQTSVCLKWTEKWLERQATETILKLKRSLGEKSVQWEDNCASYVNFSDATLEYNDGPLKTGEPLKAYYGPNIKRLVELKQKIDPENHFKWPWERDPQKGGNLPQSALTSKAIPADQIELAIADESTIAKQAEFLTDSIAAKSWSTFVLPPPSYTELYAPSYMTDHWTATAPS